MTLDEGNDLLKVSVIHFVPSMLNAFLDYVELAGEAEKLSSLKQVFCSGEVLSKQLVSRFMKLLYDTNQTALSNLYGPTEATIDVSYFDCEKDYETYDSIPIGKPIDNIQLFIMKDGKMCRIGEAGEICIAGIGLSKGYLNQENLTSEKYIENPYRKGSKIYLTGDLGRFLPDGNIEYIGRNDFQVKIRGLRIELEEIEAVIKKFYRNQNVLTECKILAKQINADLKK